MCEATRGSDGSEMCKGSGAARRAWARLCRGAMASGVALVAVTPAGPAYAQGCARTIKADVVALDQPYMFNRLGAGNLNGQIFALRRDVVPAAGAAGKVNLRPDKRPRPMVLRANVGDCLIIEFQNLLTPDSTGKAPGASLNAEGLEVADPATQVNQNSPVAPNGRQTYRYYAKAEGNFLLFSGGDPGGSQAKNGLFGSINVQPAGAEWYRSQVTRADLLAATLRRDKAPAVAFSPETRPEGCRIFEDPYEEVHGAAKVPAKGEMTRRSADRQTLQSTDVCFDPDGRVFTASGHPVINYHSPVLQMLQPVQTVGPDRATHEIVYSDLTAIITGPNAGRFTYNQDSPSFRSNPASPDRRQPYREFTAIYHQAGGQQAFNFLQDPDLNNTLAAGADGFGINYGVAGIGAEVLANRLGVGPMGRADAVDLKYEEFFLSGWAVGDPAMVVDIPADQTTANARYNPNGPLLTVPTVAPPQAMKATKAYFPDDPSNVYHSYMRDHVKIRIAHAGPGPSHVHHLHAHQWLHSPNADDGSYSDSQLIIPGSAYTLEITYGGSGNRNLTVGDSIFHCHFYPHFAQGMWSLWRVHDVLESGTKLDGEGRPLPSWNRALPDGEIVLGTPIPAVVPMPTLAMAPIPARVRLSTAADDYPLPIGPTAKFDSLAGRRAIVEPIPMAAASSPEYRNPGFPFFVPGVAGHRAPHPPLDFAWKEGSDGAPILNADGTRQYLDGGLPRHQALGGETVRELHTRWDFSKDFIAYSTEDKKAQTDATVIAGSLVAFQLPEDGTAVERAAMHAHATRTHPTPLPNGDPGNFTLNGLPPVPGAPYAAPRSTTPARRPRASGATRLPSCSGTSS